MPKRGDFLKKKKGGGRGCLKENIIKINLYKNLMTLFSKRRVISLPPIFNIHNQYHITLAPRRKKSCHQHINIQVEKIQSTYQIINKYRSLSTIKFQVTVNCEDQITLKKTRKGCTLPFIVKL